jgi:hypothetical protein
MRQTITAKVLAIFTLATGVLFAQTSQPKPAVIRGIVHDATALKTPIPGVQITLTNLGKKEDVRMVSNRQAEFSFEAAPGEYQLRGELPGFETSLLGPIKAKEGETVRIDLILTVGPVKTFIEVDTKKDQPL